MEGIANTHREAHRQAAVDHAEESERARQAFRSGSCASARPTGGARSISRGGGRGGGRQAEAVAAVAELEGLKRTMDAQIENNKRANEAELQSAIREVQSSRLSAAGEARAGAQREPAAEAERVATAELERRTRGELNAAR